MNFPLGDILMTFQEQNAKEQIDNRRERRRASRLLLWILMPVVLIGVGSCAACVSLALA